MIAIILALCTLLAWAGADISGTNPPSGSCLCMTTAGVNVRGTACGSVIGSTGTGQCYVYGGQKQSCTLDSVTYEFFQVDFSGQTGWIAGNFMRLGVPTECGEPPSQPDDEVRAMWVATAWNIDWPRSATDSPEAQRSQLLEHFDAMTELHMNTLVLQVRTAGDAFYDSDYEPWSRYLTGTQGTPPSPLWDPLSFAITEAHQRNIELHAWLNPYRANMAPNWDGLSGDHMANRFRQHAHPYGSTLWMDPGAQEVVDHLVDVVNDIVTRYDVDGIHFDDYFYPYPPTGNPPFPDDVTWNDYVNGGGQLSRDDWRRDNVDRMIERVYNEIKAIKNHVKFGVSPFGIYRPGHPSGMPPPIAGLDPYAVLFADAKLWLENGWLDYFNPQLYWAIDPPAQSYPTLLDWWLDNNPMNRHIYAGNALYKLDDNDWPVSEIENQIQISRDRQDRISLGNVHFSAQFIRDDYKGLRAALRTRHYNSPVGMPDMPWLDLRGAPASPTNVNIQNGLMTWTAENTEFLRSWYIYQVFPDNWILLHIVNPADTSISLEPGQYAIKAVDRIGMKSEPVLVSVPDTGVYVG